MEKNQSSSNTTGVCKKIRKAVTVNPAFRRIRRISLRPQHFLPATTRQDSSPPAPNAQTKPAALEQLPGLAEGPRRLETPENRKAAGVVPVEFVPSISLKKPNDTGKNEISGKAGGKGHDQAVKVVRNIELEPKPAHVLEQQKTNPKAEVASPRLQRKKSGIDNINEKFSDYINRAKCKFRSFRSTSNVDAGPAGKALGRLDSINEKFSNYINRAKMKIRTTSNVGSGKSDPPNKE